MLIASISVPGGGGSGPEAEVATLSQMSSPFTWDMEAVYPHKAMSTLKMPPRPFEPKQLAIITDPDTTSGEHDWIQEPPVTSSAPASGKDVGYTSCVYIWMEMEKRPDGKASYPPGRGIASLPGTLPPATHLEC